MKGKPLKGSIALFMRKTANTRMHSRKMDIVASHEEEDGASNASEKAKASDSCNLRTKEVMHEFN